MRENVRIANGVNRIIPSLDHYREELVQVAAVAVAMIESVDRATNDQEHLKGGKR